MKRTFAIGLAAAAIAATLTATGGAALAQPKHWKPYYPHSYPHYSQPNYVAPFFFGLGLGLAAPYFYQPYPYPYPYPYPPYPAYAYNSPHVQWCMAHYRTYNWRTNTYFIRPGVPAICVSPYPYN